MTQTLKWPQFVALRPRLSRNNARAGRFLSGSRKEERMNIDDVLTIGRDALLTTLMASAPMLLTGMAVGLIISIFQSVTQIQEITLTFVPKIIVVMVSFVLFLPWIMAVLMNFVEPLFGEFHRIVR